MKKTILAVGAHPDDIEIGCGGTLSLFSLHGYAIAHVIATSGEEGSLRTPKADLAAQRETEAQNSARIIGAENVFFLREPDGLTDYSRASKTMLTSLIRELRPTAMFTHARSDYFPDYQIVHQLSIAAAVASAGPWYLEAIGEPYQVPRIFGYEAWSPIPSHQSVFNISSTLATKLSALREHRSQIANLDYVSAVEGLARYRGAMTFTRTHAEVFEVLRLEENPFIPYD